MENLCQRCQVLPKIENTPKVVYFMVPVEVLLEKLKKVLEKMNLQFSTEKGLLKVKVEKFRDFMEEFSKSSDFSSPELNDILCISLDESEDLSFTSFYKLKPLKTWFSLLKSQEYFEILTEQRLTVHFHPVLESENLTVVGYETLVRGVRRDGTLISPKQLFELAEETDTLFYLDRFCREMSVKMAAVKKLNHYKIFINFVPTSIYDPVSCLRSTIEWAKCLELSPSNLVFEVVESYRVSDIEHLKNVLNYYRANGFLVALDDVGSGYSNLNVLVNLKPDIVKIDREIIRNIHNDELKQSVFKAIIMLSKESQIRTLAEGVETVQEYEFIRKHVDFVQGFLFAKPNPEPIRQIDFHLY